MRSSGDSEAAKAAGSAERAGLTADFRRWNGDDGTGDDGTGDGGTGDGLLAHDRLQLELQHRSLLPPCDLRSWGARRCAGWIRSEIAGAQ